MKSRHPVLLAAALTSVLLMGPGALAQGLLFEDAAGDTTMFPAGSSVYPYRDAVDILSFQASMDGDDAVLHLEVADLAAITEMPPEVYTNRAFASWIDFQVRTDQNDTTPALFTIYVDYVAGASVLFQTGWRFELYDAQREDYELRGGADLTTNTVSIWVPLDILGGRVLSQFEIQADTNLAYGLYSYDRAPDRGPCDCEFFAVAPADNSTLELTGVEEHQEEEANAPWVASSLLALLLVVAFRGARPGY